MLQLKALEQARESTWYALRQHFVTPQAPEVFNQEKYNSKADVWGVGAVLYELMTLLPPSVERSGFDFNKIPAEYDPVLRKLCEAMLSPNANERPSMPDVIRLLSSTPSFPKELMRVAVSELPEFSANFPPSFLGAGVGLTFELMENGGLYVVAMSPGAPAQRSGLIDM